MQGSRWLMTLAFAAVSLAAGAADGAAQHSSTTRFTYDACAAAPSPEPGVIEVRHCKGPSEIPVRWMAEPDSSSVSFGDKPVQEEVKLGAAFEVEPVIEWRAARRNARPAAAIVRYRAGDRIGRLNRRVLVVHRLEPSGASCVMAVVRGGKADRRARRLADASAPTFVCGKSARLKP